MQGDFLVVPDTQTVAVVLHLHFARMRKGQHVVMQHAHQDGAGQVAAAEHDRALGPYMVFRERAQRDGGSWIRQ
ncbi:hypothetical protein D3C84_1069600 [compost metagenome]